MLSSSDAKFRCLWHMFVWSIMLTLVSQFYVLTDHIAFYIFGSLGIIVLPFVTSLYSTTAGRRGASLLRVAYVLCDPVLACMAVVPVLLLNKLSPLISEMECLSIDIKSWNETLSCLGNKSTSPLRKIAKDRRVDFSLKPGFWLERRNFLTAIEISIVIPCILALIMGRRTRKMNYPTALLTFTYWLITSIECITLIETALLCGSSRVHYAVTTEVTVCVACILANSYAVVTLCSYVSPITCRGDSVAVAARFNAVYKCLVGLTGVIFVEIPQLVARFQLIASTSDWPSMSETSNYLYRGAFNYDNTIYERYTYKNPIQNPQSNDTEAGNTLGHDVESTVSSLDVGRVDSSNHALLSPSIVNITRSLEDRSLVYKQHFPATFYVWAFKDAIMIVIIIAAIVLQQIGTSPPIFFRILGEGRGCAGVAFDNPDAMFIPEKRDKYIVTRCAQCREADFRDGTPRPKSLLNAKRLGTIDSAEDSSFFGHKKHVHETSPRGRFGAKSHKYFSKHIPNNNGESEREKKSWDETAVLPNSDAEILSADNSNKLNGEFKEPGCSLNNEIDTENRANESIESTNSAIANDVTIKNLPDNIKEATSLLRHQISADGGAVNHESKRKKSVKFSLSENSADSAKPPGDNIFILQAMVPVLKNSNQNPHPTHSSSTNNSTDIAPTILDSGTSQNRTNMLNTLNLSR